jgi:hypothetical protein
MSRFAKSRFYYPECPVAFPPNAISELMDGAMVTTAQQHQIIEPGFPAVRPVHDVVALHIPIMATARKLAMPVTGQQRTPS